MPWKECHVVDERLRFIARLLDGEKMTGLCAEFGISRKTGYKIYTRYKGCGIEGLTDRSRRSQRHANQLPSAIETLIVRLKKDYPTWGAPKIRERLRRRYATVHCPAISTVHAVLDRHGLVNPRDSATLRCRDALLSECREVPPARASQREDIRDVHVRGLLTRPRARGYAFAYVKEM